MAYSSIYHKLLKVGMIGADLQRGLEGNHLFMIVVGFSSFELLQCSVVVCHVSVILWFCFGEIIVQSMGNPTSSL